MHDHFSDCSGLSQESYTAMHIPKSNRFGTSDVCLSSDCAFVPGELVIHRHEEKIQDETENVITFHPASVLPMMGRLELCLL